MSGKQHKQHNGNENTAKSNGQRVSNRSVKSAGVNPGTAGQTTKHGGPQAQGAVTA
jgi:hypothetical protein